MSKQDMPNTPSDNSIVPQSEKSLVHMSSSQGKKLLKWFTLETIGNWSYDQIGVLGRSAFITALMAFVVRYASRIPLDIELIIALFIVALIFFGVQRYIEKYRNKQPKVTLLEFNL